MRNKVRMWANGIDVIPYSGPKTSRRHGEDGCYRTIEGVMANTGQPSVERALEVITDSFRGIGSEDQPDEEEADAAEIQVPDDLESPEDRTHESPVREEAPSHRTDKDSTKVTSITPHVAKSENTEHSQTNPTSSSTQDDLAGDGPREGDGPVGSGNSSSEKSGHETGEPEGETQPAQRNQDAEAFDATKHQTAADDSLKDDGRGSSDAEVSREEAWNAETLNTKEVTTNDSSSANDIAGRETAKEAGEIALTDGPQALKIASTKEVNVSSEDTRLMNLPTKSSADSVDNQMSQPLPGPSPLSTQFEQPAPEQIPTDEEVHQTKNQRDSKEEQNVALLDNSPQTKERGDRVPHNNDEQESRTTDDDELPSNESCQPIDEVGFALKPSEDPGAYLKTNGSMDEEVDAATRNVANVKADASRPEEVSRTSFAETVQGSLNCPKAADSASHDPSHPADADRRFQPSNYHEELPADSEIETENERPETEDEPQESDGDHIEADNLLTETEAGSANVEGRPSGADCGPAATEGGSAGAESGPAESPRLVASIRSLLRHLSPVTERRRQEGDHRDTHDGHQAPTRAKRFPKFWSHHSRRDRKSEPISTHDSAHHGSHVSRSGKLTILTRQRPFTMATVSQMAAPEGHAAGRIPVLPTSAL
ncbi:dentin sialophosphoprotein-like [Amphibalanus amphitrite]|uniref:dentin sialophosphoprotein-like n=1 Tax=Amphibalanus amphitrite TaxID=1232801 RepID=UPI001C913A23|nr:dentin sialophosphoprotein-like [Amphibalanus amphitrite]